METIFSRFVAMEIIGVVVMPTVVMTTTVISLAQTTRGIRGGSCDADEEDVGGEKSRSQVSMANALTNCHTATF